MTNEQIKFRLEEIISIAENTKKQSNKELGYQETIESNFQPVTKGLSRMHYVERNFEEQLATTIIHFDLLKEVKKLANDI